MDLFYREYGKDSPVLVILHGILGSGRNWHTVAGHLGRMCRVIVPDQRNHGRSPHAPEHHLKDLAHDIYALQKKAGAFPAIILGHSMGGLVAMEMALHMPEAVDGLIVVDIAPRPHRAGVAQVLHAMRRIDLLQHGKKSAVDAALEVSIADPLVRQFVLTNLAVTRSGLRWRVNLPVLIEFLQESQAYSPAPTDQYAGPALFIRGEKSRYILNEDLELIRHFFPQATLETVPGAGHWVHYEQPEILTRLVTDFVMQQRRD